MKNKKIKIPLILLCVILVVVSASLFLIHNKLSKVKAVKISKKPSELKIDTKKFNDTSIDKNYINILLLGEDSRDKATDPGRSDSVMILTLDKAHNKIKLTSLMRDMIMDNMVGQGPMKGKTQDRLNHAYAYGGPQLSIQVVNDNFSMNIKDFVVVDFTHFDNIIDSVGGVDINISDDEVKIANSYIKEVANLQKISAPYLTHGGLQHLNGIQALGYCRIRYVGNEDFERTQRQRTVLMQVLQKISKMSLPDASNAMDAILPNVTTSLSQTDMLSALTYVIMNKVNNIEQLRLPEDKPGYNYTTYVNDTYFLGWDKPKNVADLHQFIFEGDLK